MLLEIYRSFPDLLCSNGSLPEDYIRHLLVTLAINVLALLATIAQASRTKAIQILPLIIAGGAYVAIGGVFVRGCIASGPVAVLYRYILTLAETMTTCFYVAGLASLLDLRVCYNIDCHC